MTELQDLLDELLEKGEVSKETYSYIEKVIQDSEHNI
jgi:hypothetical protein